MEHCKLQAVLVMWEMGPLAKASSECVIVAVYGAPVKASNLFMDETNELLIDFLTWSFMRNRLMYRVFTSVILNATLALEDSATPSRAKSPLSRLMQSARLI